MFRQGCGTGRVDWAPADPLPSLTHGPSNMRTECFVTNEFLHPRERVEKSGPWLPSKRMKESVKIRGPRGRVKRV